jgi:plastocyanin
VRSHVLLVLLVLAAPLASATDATIRIANYTFDPIRLEVAPGATVTVSNADAEPHAMKTSDGAITFLPSVNAGANATFTAPTTPGGYPYYCPFHTGPQPDAANPTFMHGVLVVRAANVTPTATTQATTITTATGASATTPTPTHKDPGFEAVALVVAAALAVVLLRRR